MHLFAFILQNICQVILQIPVRYTCCTIFFDICINMAGIFMKAREQIMCKSIEYEPGKNVGLSCSNQHGYKTFTWLA